MPNFIVRNFQAISEARLRVEGLTLLVGESSSGKTACFRAIFAATNNRFKNGQVKNGQDSAVVKIQLPDSPDVFTAIRPWAGSIKMALGNERFDKIGRTLPHQIDEFFNFGTLDVGGEKFSLNFHDQFQKPLLLEFSQQRVMEILSASKGIDDLNFAKDTIQDLRVQNKGAFKAVDAILSEAKSNLSDAKSKVELYKPLNDSLEQSWSKSINLHDNLDRLHVLSEYFDSVALVESKISYLQRLFSLASKLDSLSTESKSLDVLSVWMVQLVAMGIREDKLQTKCSILSKIESIDISAVTSKLCQLSSLQEFLTMSFDTSILEGRISICKSLEKNKSVSDRVRSTGQRLDNLKDSLSQLDTVSVRIQELNRVVVDHICPVCHSKVE